MMEPEIVPSCSTVDKLRVAYQELLVEMYSDILTSPPESLDEKTRVRAFTAAMAVVLCGIGLENGADKRTILRLVQKNFDATQRIFRESQN